MPCGQHILMGKSSFDSLPGWERDLWSGQRERLAANCLVPDQYYTNKEQYGRYCVMPNGVVVPHTPTDAKWTMAPFIWEHCPESYSYVIEYYLGKLIETIAAGDVDEAVMFAGVFGHFLQDSSQPAHLVHNDWLYTLVSRPSGRYRHLHRDLDDADPDEEALKEVRPRLLGTSLAEAASQLRAEYEKMIQAAMAQLVPMITAAYAQDEAAMSLAITGSYRAAAAITASAWHTAHCVAARRFDDDEVRDLETVRLNRVPYYFGFTIDPYGFRPLMDFACDREGNTVPLVLRVKGAKGGAKQRSFADGIAMSWGNVQYDIPGGVYERFLARIGVLSSEPAHAGAVFKVVLSGGPVVYEPGLATVLDYGGPIAFDSGVLTAAAPAIEIAVQLDGATGITLIVECPDEPTHALWVEPVLIKKPEPVPATREV